MITMVNLSKHYGRIMAVQDLNLHIEAGEFFGFLGPNGAGKTTTIKILVGLLKPSGGSATVAGHDIQQEPLQAKRQIGFIPDRPFVYEKLSGREFLRFVANLYGMEARSSTARSEDLLDLFELTAWGDELIESYSHGMRQKLIMSAALLHHPRVLVVDEPMVGLDPKGARLVKRILRGLCDRGTTIFMSTHTLEVAEQMCDRIGIIQGGALLALGTKDELRQLVQNDVSRLEDIFLQLTGGTDTQEETIPF
jgi:ABC-2 type transport system ATP-binding protein